MSDSDDIVERLRAAAAYEGLRGRDKVAAMLTEAADLIERQRVTLARWEAAAAMMRGTMQAIVAADEPVVITPAEPNTPR